MITFKDFLNERAVDKEPEYITAELRRAIDVIKDKCKNALWMFKEDRPLFRGDPKLHDAIGNEAYGIIDTSKTVRKSQNTSNYYTLILDNHPGRTDFPKRSKSLIGTTSLKTAINYMKGESKTPYVMIPFDDAKIGVVNKADMWYTKIQIFGQQMEIEEANEAWAAIDRLGIENTYNRYLSDDDWSKWIKFDKLLKENDWDATKVFNSIVNTPNLFRKNFLDEVYGAYSAKDTGHTAYTTKTLPHSIEKSEVWVGGKILLMTASNFEMIRTEMGYGAEGE